MSQRSGPGSGRGDEGPRRVAGGSQRSRGQPPSSAGSQRGVQGPPPVAPPVGAVVGRIYRPSADPAPTYNQAVTNQENGYQRSPNLSSLSLAPESLPNRPAYGTKGDHVTVWANYFELLFDRNLVLYQYNIDIQPPAVGRKRARIIELVLQQPEFVAWRHRICSDFRSTLISRVPLDDELTACNITYLSELETEPRRGATPYQIRLQRTKTLLARRLLEYLTSTNMGTAFDEKDVLTQAFNVLLNHYAKSHGDITFGNKTFPKDLVGSDLGGGLMAIRGFFSSVRAATGRLLVNVNVCCSAFYRPGPLTSLIAARRSQDTYGLEQFLKGVRVKTSHTGTPRIRTILALASPSDGQNSTETRRPIVPGLGAGANQVQFWLREQNRYVTVSEFFRTNYNIRLDNERLPVVNVGSRASPVYLPPQVCDVMVGQKAGVKLDADQTSRMINHAIRWPPPAQNALSIVRDGMSMLGMSRRTNRLLDSFDVRINPNLTIVPARKLVKPGVAYGNRRSALVNESAAWNLRGLAMSRPATIRAETWGWLFIHMTGYPSAFGSLDLFKAALNSFRVSLRGTGINIGEASPGSRRLPISNVEDPELERVLTTASEKLGLLYIILPAKHTALYNRIKRVCDVKVGLVNICSVGNKLVESTGRPQYFGNVALKFNLKGGGDNQLVDPSRLHFVSQGDTMIVGIDVTHPDANSSSRAPSIAAMVASINRNLAQWPATSSIQMNSRQEMVDSLKDMLKRHLNLWKTEGKHSRFPRNILVYRDGVSDGQHKMVKDYELPLLRQACEDVYDRAGEERPRITIVIVTKRHHTRFGPTTEGSADSNGNCPAGTVTDRGITEAHQWDFWLQAHSAIQGHARPAHYVVAHDEIFRVAPRAHGYNVADTLEDVTQSLHYVFGRCTRAVSYCTPAYYADLVCDRARRYLSSLFDPSTHSDAASLLSELDRLDDDGRRARLQELINPHSRVRNKMYYI